jgi:hypothetical protein
MRYDIDVVIRLRIYSVMGAMAVILTSLAFGTWCILHMWSNMDGRYPDGHLREDLPAYS